MMEKVVAGYEFKRLRIKVKGKRSEQIIYAKG